MTEQDEPIVALVARSFDSVRMHRSAQDIVARGRGLRRRRTAIPALAATAVAAGTAMAVTAPWNTAAQSASASRPQSVNVDLAAWSVHTNPDQTVTLTLRQLKDADKLRQVLAQAGVRAYSFADPGSVPSCLATVGDAPFGGVPLKIAMVAPTPTRIDPAKSPVSDETTVEFDPKVMPKGSALVLTNMQHFVALRAVMVPDGCMPAPASAPASTGS
jgi:hypothetical protein